MKNTYRPMPCEIRKNLIEFARKTWFNDGAEGETVHRLCSELEVALSDKHELIEQVDKKDAELAQLKSQKCGTCHNWIKVYDASNDTTPSEGRCDWRRIYCDEEVSCPDWEQRKEEKLVKEIGSSVVR